MFSSRLTTGWRGAWRRPTARALLCGLAAVIAVLPASTLGAGGGSGGAAGVFHPPPVRHVFVIALENESYGSTFGDPRADPYLAAVLPSKGALLTEYYATGHESNDNYVSLVSGQPPNLENQIDCPLYDDLLGGITLPGGVETGVGCVYPTPVQTIGNQLTATGRTWKAYEEDMGNDPARESPACGHPALNSPDTTQTAVAGDGYATRHDPFVYFHSVVDGQTYCDAHVVALGTPSGGMPPSALKGETGLAHDLRSVATTPNYSFITPNLCDDGHDYPCTNQPNGSSALADVDTFLQKWVPKIMSSPAFERNGLLEITFDEAEGDASACCGEQPGPGSPFPGLNGPGGGLVGAVLLSPFIKGGTKVATPYNHYSSLASVEDLFGLPRLADAASVTTFGPDVFTRS